MRPKPSSLDRPEKAVAQQQGKERVPRPRNAFIIFRSWYIGKVKAGVDMDAGKSDTEDDATIEKVTTTTASLTRPSHSISHQNELSKRAAKAWNGMNHEERKPYLEEANREKEWHKLMYPDYVYAPGGVGVKVGGKGKEGAPQHARRDTSSKHAEKNQAQAEGVEETQAIAFERVDEVKKDERINVLGIGTMHPLTDLGCWMIDWETMRHQQGREGKVSEDKVQHCDIDAKLKVSKPLFPTRLPEV